LGELAAYLRALPREHHYAVEVRHPAFFAGGADERAFDTVLREAGAERVNFDTVAVHASTANDPQTAESKRRKPRVPHRTTAIGPRPFVRFVGDPAVEKNDAALHAWAGLVLGWLAEGRDVHFFVHHPNDDFAPPLARRFQAILHALSPTSPPPPPWPGEQGDAEQLTLL
jgi:uncharacterized protein YecE (DUF72 family)